MNSGRFVLIAALFFIDVRVRAEDSHKETECWGKQIPCAVQATDHKREFKNGDFIFVLAAGSLAQQRDQKTIQLVDGDFYIEIDKPMLFNTPYASVTCASVCKALVSRQISGLTVKALEGDWTVQRLGEKRVYTLGAGLQISIGEVETSGMAQMDFPQSLPWASTVKEWSKLYVGSAELFKSDVTQFRRDWKTAVESAAKVHEEVAARAVASFGEGVAKEQARRKAVEKEDAALRELFRRKNNIDP